MNADIKPDDLFVEIEQGYSESIVVPLDKLEDALDILCRYAYRARGYGKERTYAPVAVPDPDFGLEMRLVPGSKLLAGALAARLNAAKEDSQ